MLLIPGWRDHADQVTGRIVTARQIAVKVDAPLVPGTCDRVRDAAEVIAFASDHGVPVAIKAAFGGGGRGMKVAYTIEEIPERFESAVREATGAFGRGDCFAERYLDRPRHVEAQVLADMHGNVVVVGTRDCSLQRRFQKLVEEAPAPFLSNEQRARIHSSAKAICREAKYYGAGTVEYLVSRDGRISFLEVNTRLQVEHPVTEETVGIDLVREQFRIAEGEELSLTEDPAPRGHSIEFRINGEDVGRDFLPVPGQITMFASPSGPGVRLDSGVETGSVMGSQFDSMLAKLIVTGATRAEALERSRRALAEFRIEGLPTVLPFHRAIVADPAFTGLRSADGSATFSVHTRWIETEWNNNVEPFAIGEPAGDDASAPRQRITVEVGGRRVEISLPGQLAFASVGAPGRNTAARANPQPRRRGASGTASGDTVTASLQGTVVKVAAKEGQAVQAGDLIVVLEAMKMEIPVNAHKAGVVTNLTIQSGAAITAGATICTIAGK